MARTPDCTASAICRPTGTGQDGFLLIEVLVALLIFSVAALGLVGLQVSMTRATTGAQFRASAAYLAHDLVGRLWTDSAQLARYDSAQCAGYAPCKAWLDKVGTSLPEGAATTSVDAATGTVTIALTWKVPGEDTHRLNTTTSINPNAL